MMFVTKNDSRFAYPGETVTLAQALARPLILPSLQHGVRPRIEAVARGAGLMLGNVTDINSVAILKSAILADLGATILPLAPLLSEIERGAMNAQRIVAAQLSRTVVLCSSRNIPLTNASAAVQKLVLAVTRELCTGGRWLGARALVPQPPTQ
jgi:LysR family nitrogen assimilation transcriptional regulator